MERNFRDGLAQGFLSGVLYSLTICLVLLTFMWAAQGEPSGDLPLSEYIEEVKPQRPVVRYCIDHDETLPADKDSTGYEAIFLFKPCKEHEEDI